MATTAASTSSGPPVGHTVNTVAIVFGVVTICVMTIRLYGRIALVHAVGVDDSSLYILQKKSRDSHTDMNHSSDVDCKCRSTAVQLFQTSPNWALDTVMGLHNCNYFR